MMAILIAVAAFLGVPLICNGEPKDVDLSQPYLVCHKTQSPDGRFAVAWGLPKHRDLWEKICQVDKAKTGDQEKDLPSADVLGDLQTNIGDDVENYIVDLSEKKIIRKLPSTYCEVAGFHRGKDTLEVVWSHASNIVFINQQYYIEPLPFCAVRIVQGKAGSVLDLNKGFVSRLRNHFAKSIPPKAPITKTDLTFSFSNPEQLDESHFSVQAEGGVYSKSGYNWSELADIRFTLTPSGENDLTLKVVDIRKAGRNN